MEIWQRELINLQNRTDTKNWFQNRKTIIKRSVRFYIHFSWNHIWIIKGTIIFVIADLIRKVINQPVDSVFAHHLGLTKTLFNMVIKEHKDQSRQRFQPTTFLSTLRSSIANSSHLFLHPLHPSAKIESYFKTCLWNIVKIHPSYTHIIEYEQWRSHLFFPFSLIISPIICARAQLQTTLSS